MQMCAEDGGIYEPFDPHNNCFVRSFFLNSYSILLSRPLFSLSLQAAEHSGGEGGRGQGGDGTFLPGLHGPGVDGAARRPRGRPAAQDHGGDRRLCGGDGAAGSERGPAATGFRHPRPQTVDGFGSG